MSNIYYALKSLQTQTQSQISVIIIERQLISKECCVPTQTEKKKKKNDIELVTYRTRYELFTKVDSCIIPHSQACKPNQIIPHNHAITNFICNYFRSTCSCSIQKYKFEICLFIYFMLIANTFAESMQIPNIVV